MRSDVTYLESFLDHISSFPAELRRNLDLMKDQDKTCTELFEEMTKLQKEYIERAEWKMEKLEIVDGNSIRVLGTDDDGPTVLPTTEELVDYIYEHDTLKRIETIEKDALQRTAEKVAVAEQSHALVDNVCKRLESDLIQIEKTLQANGGFQAPGMAKVNDLAAVQVTPGSPDWILAKVVTHDPTTGMYRLSDEDTESNKIFDLPQSQVVILGGLRNLSKGETVFAIYPDTTSFYQATIAQVPRKSTGGGSFVMVNFVDDSDENGITHDKAVLLKHIMLPPY
ncbi:unnamed protein product [Cylindrotheca closterium]|uniref:SGF29 C-terminal domain-containing protein n=1 Tax=Cylindrotheca closterium TaxID=2856 RepID=A0AAD2FG01_9STRA|nr:unnamed protein product [Cylindrotheca closterium]